GKSVLPSVSEGSSRRLFADRSRRAYESGIGNMPQDQSCAVIEAGDKTRIYFRVRIHEEAACEDGGNRWTDLELWRAPGESPDPVPAKSELLLTKRISQWNPVCGKGPTQPMVLELREAALDLVFELKYLGSFQENPRKPWRD